MKICEICGRGHMTSNSRSKSNIATRRLQKINIQYATVKGKRMRLCTRCIRTLVKKSELKKSG